MLQAPSVPHTMARTSPPAVLVKLGGAAITNKSQLETLDGTVLASCAQQLAQIYALRGACFIVVHGAGSFGHHQAKASGVAGGGIRTSCHVRSGFAGVRASVTKLNSLVVSALLAAGVPAVGLSPCGTWTTSNRRLVADGCGAAAALLAAGLVPVLHGDCVLDESLGCTILSGDLIITRLCQRLRPPLVVFLTNVDGIFDRPPEEPGAQLITRLEVDREQEEQPMLVSSGSGGSGGGAGLGFTAFNQLGEVVHSLTTSCAAHDTTGGVLTKIQEAVEVAKAGGEVRIARAGGPDAAAACSPDPLPPGWVGTQGKGRRMHRGDDRAAQWRDGRPFTAAPKHGHHIPTMLSQAESNILVCVGLALPHFLYAAIWFFPQLWMAVFKKRSVEAFETLAWALKGVQFLSVAYWWLLRKPDGVDLAAIPLTAWAAGVPLFAFGQWLNVSIFKAIGHAGVYYGFKLGHTIPWYSGFPFNFVSHPQYVGSVLSVVGAAVLVWGQAPEGLGLLVTYWTLLYAATAFQEDKLHLD
ncbi:hypothetical protein D9Q98_003456 [Chlorella vulgaris]|uniref:Isopentenyl phosphate kinase n=1 Tax=Chlorella vulgaris TaxID=3077 RepID=A0A9D4TSU4_CHLVU|nr:hypothetical protein D9Q98_003456 [Chlorella vulgaris]